MQRTAPPTGARPRPRMLLATAALYAGWLVFLAVVAVIASRGG